MKIKDHAPAQLLAKITDRLSDIEQRERMIIRFPFGHQFNRIEIYCSETATNPSAIGEAMSGEAFDGIVKLQVFTDYTNKPAQTSSYTYKKELFAFLPKFVDKIYSTMEPAQ
jgi:hypothetical protein